MEDMIILKSTVLGEVELEIHKEDDLFVLYFKECGEYTSSDTHLTLMGAEIAMEHEAKIIRSKIYSE